MRSSHGSSQKTKICSIEKCLANKDLSLLKRAYHNQKVRDRELPVATSSAVENIPTVFHTTIKTEGGNAVLTKFIIQMISNAVLMAHSPALMVPVRLLRPLKCKLRAVSTIFHTLLYINYPIQYIYAQLNSLISCFT